MDVRKFFIVRFTVAKILRVLKQKSNGHYLAYCFTVAKILRVLKRAVLKGDVVGSFTVAKILRVLKLSRISAIFNFVLQ